MKETKQKLTEMITQLRAKRNNADAALAPTVRASHHENLFKMELEAINLLYQTELVEVRMKMPPVTPQGGTGGAH